MTPILPQLFVHPLNAFSMGRPEQHLDRLWRLMAIMKLLGAAIRPKLKNATTPYFAHKTEKWGSMHFQ